MSKSKCSQRAFNHPVNFFFLLTTGEKRSLMSGFDMKKIIFEITEDETEGGFIARAPRYSIVTQAETWSDLHINVREAGLCHFDERMVPR